MADAVLPPDWAKWHVGQRVWCVNTPTTGGNKTEIRPLSGEIYTIRELCMTPFRVNGIYKGDDLTCRLVEIINLPQQYYWVGGNRVMEFTFRMRWFQPLREQNIEIFRQMCVEAPAKAKKARVE